MISGTSPSNGKVVVAATDDGNVGGCHDTEDKVPGYEHDAKNASPKKRKQATAPKLIDYNKRHLERNLSANQYVQMFLKGLRNDSEFRHYMSRAMTESGVSRNKTVFVTFKQRFV